jgi:hypothetical protein
MMAVTAIALLACGIGGIGFAFIGGFFIFIAMMCLLDTLADWALREGWRYDGGRALLMGALGVALSVPLIYIPSHYGQIITKWAAS